MIELKNISKSYSTGASPVNALVDINLKLKRDEFLAVMGPSGSGKSTLLHILGALDSPSEGDYFLEDINIVDLSDRELSRIRNEHFGFVFQSYNLFPELTALENVTMPLVLAGKPPGARREKGLELLEMVDMTHRLNHFPSQLSGGENQRVAVARALANDPDLILADEPTGNLASSQEEEILEIFRNLHEQEVALIIVTHNPRVASWGKRLIRLQDGGIVLDSTIAHRFDPTLLPQEEGGR